MDPDLSALDAALADRGLDGYLVDASSADADQRYLSGFSASDAFVTLYTPDTTALLVSGLEFARAKNQSRADAVRRGADYDVDDDAGRGATLAAFCREFDADSVAVPSRFPYGTATAVSEAGVDLTLDDDGLVTDVRAVKTDWEVEQVRRAQRANEAAMRAARDRIAGADVVDGVLHDGGEPLTSERVRREVEMTLLEHDCALDETIVACGSDAAEPHNRGSGPLAADETIVVDIFPRDKASGYHADMTRTFVRGDPTDAARDFYDATVEALDAALETVAPGNTGADVHDAVCDVYEEWGYSTPRDDEPSETGFIHSTGHGVGLDVHEQPGVNGDGPELEPGHVITVEPGLYDPAVGGVRVEDLVVVTEDGHENLTTLDRTFVLE